MDRVDQRVKVGIFECHKSEERSDIEIIIMGNRALKHKPAVNKAVSSQGVGVAKSKLESVI